MIVVKSFQPSPLLTLMLMTSILFVSALIPGTPHRAEVLLENYALQRKRHSPDDVPTTETRSRTR